MLSIIVRIALALLTVSIAVIGLAHEQPVNESDLRALLIPPEGCAMPCFLGIQPGVTSVDEAVILLSDHPWIERVFVERRPLVHYLYWTWNGSQPDFVDDPRSRMPPHLWAQNRIVQYIALPTDIPYADLFTLWGTPDGGRFDASRFRDSSGFRSNANHAAAYFNGQVLIDTDVHCPIEERRFWESTVMLTYYATPNTRGVLETYRLADWLYGSECAGL
jgi:hypothetical protein